jgi:peptidoglycan-N-acetylglucosamine deacetylase
MMIAILSLLICFQWTHAQTTPVDYLDWETEILFSERMDFPMSQIMCVGGECTPGGMKRNQIALTFDDGPNSNTLRVLEALRHYGVPATFFVHIGERSYGPNTRSILQSIRSGGHKIANHAPSHRPLSGPTNNETVIRSLLDTHSVIENYLSRNDLLLFRNPGGYWSASRARALNAHPFLRNYVGPIFWNAGGENVYRNGELVDAADWRCQQRRMSASTCAQGYYRKIMSNYRSGQGSLVLMHDIHRVTGDLLPHLFEMLANSGVNWEFVFVQDIPAVRHMDQAT